MNQYQSNIRAQSSLFFNRTEKEVCIESVPLSFDDLLKRKDVKVLAPRLRKAFLVSTFCIKFIIKPWLNSKANYFLHSHVENLASLWL